MRGRLRQGGAQRVSGVVRGYVAGVGDLRLSVVRRLGLPRCLGLYR